MSGVAETLDSADESLRVVSAISADELKEALQKPVDAVVVDGGAYSDGPSAIDLATELRSDIPVLLVGRRQDELAAAVGAACFFVPEGRLAHLPDLLRMIAGAEPMGSHTLSALRLLVRIHAGTLDAASPDDVMSPTLRMLGENLRWSYGEIWMPTPDGRSLRRAYSWGDDPEVAASMREGLSLVPVDPADSLPAQAWEKFQPIVVPNLQQWEGVRRKELAARYGLAAAVAAPVLKEDQPVATLLYFAHRGNVSPAEVQLLRTVASHLGDLIQLHGQRAALRGTEALLRRTFESVEEAIFVVAGDAREILECNEAACRLLGYDKDELIGATTRRFHLDEESWERFGNISAEAIRREGVYRAEGWLRKRSGEVVPTEHTVRPVLDVEGGQSAFVSVVRDLSERRGYEEELSEVRSKLAHASRISLVGQVATGMLHDLGQPLSVMESSVAEASRAASERGAAAQAIRRPVSELQRQVERLRNTVDGLRQFIRRREPTFERVSLNDAAAWSARLLRAEAQRRGATLDLDLEDRAPVIRADWVQVCQVIVNLVQNAIEAVERVAGERRVTIQTQATDAEATLRVIDTGPGVSPGMADRAFDPFCTTKPEGLGLGLAICRFNVQAHGGRLEFETGREHGAVVRVRFPL